MRISKTILSLFAVSSLAVACGGGDGDGDLSAGESFDAQIDIVCAAAFECMADYPADAPVSHDTIFGTSEGGCVAQLEGLLGFDGADVDASADAGRIDYDAADADACNAFFDGLSCADFWGNFFDGTPAEPAACDTAFIGTVADGGACELDFDCNDLDSVCDAGVCGPGA